MNYGFNLKGLRERIGLNLKETAKIIDVSDSLYSRYEKEKQTIPLKHLITLCDFFNVSLDYIFDFTDIKQYPKHTEKYNNESIKIDNNQLTKDMYNNTKENINTNIDKDINEKYYGISGIISIKNILIH